jgi:electron transfer flavoprotein beta subunit
MKGIMSARTKPIHVVAPSDVAAQTKVVTYELPPAKGDVKMIDAENIDQLVEFLHNEAKVI